MPESFVLQLPSVALGFAAVYLLLPRPRQFPAIFGVLAGVIALGLLGWQLWSGAANVAAAVEVGLFYAFSALAILAGTLLITQTNPARAALSFALVVLSTCGLFLMQGAPFLAAASIIIYAGAIIVTFLFVLMLAQQEGPSDADQRSREPLLSAVGGFALLGVLLYVLQLSYDTSEMSRVLADARSLRDELRDVLGSVKGEPVQVATTLAALESPLRKIQEFRQAVFDWKSRGRPIPPEGGPGVRPVPDEGDPIVRAVRDMADGPAVEVSKLRAKSEKEPVTAAEARRSLGSLVAALDELLRLPNTLGTLSPNPIQPQSGFSGPPSNLPATKYRRDEFGRPQLPAENVAYLGRSLFTDYLVAVEVGGTLLLVATVGAIAIAHARTGRS